MNKPNLAEMRASIFKLSMSSEARDALRDLNIEDERQVEIISGVLRAGALGASNTLRLIAALQDKGVKPSRASLEGLAAAVREHAKIAKAAP